MCVSPYEGFLTKCIPAPVADDGRTVVGIAVLASWAGELKPNLSAKPCDTGALASSRTECVL